MKRQFREQIQTLEQIQKWLRLSICRRKSVSYNHHYRGNFSSRIKNSEANASEFIILEEMYI